MKIGIVGAGISGLGAGRILQRAGHQVVVFEKSAGLGGRLATRRVGEFVFDTGATSLAPGTSELARMMTQELPTDDLVEIPLPIWAIEMGRAQPGGLNKGKGPRYSYRSGITKLAKLFAEGLDVRLNCLVESVQSNGQYQINDEGFDAIILTPPMPQTELLLASMGEKRSFGGVRFRSCLSVLLGFDQPDPKVGYSAVIDPEQRSPLFWLSMESLKSPGRAPSGYSAMVAQLGQQYSEGHYDSPDAHIIEETLVLVKRLIGPEFGEPTVAQVKRWRYSQPELTVSFDAANPVGSRAIVCGDWVVGGRVEYAYEAGVLAAQRILAL